MSKITYDEYVRKYSDFFVKITLDNDEIIKIKDFTTNLIDVKKKESHHIKDSGSEKKRWLTGLLGERAVEKYLGLKFMDFTIGNSRKYHVSDMKIAGYNCGVKTVEKGKFPIIFTFFKLLLFDDFKMNFFLLLKQ